MVFPHPNLAELENLHSLLSPKIKLSQIQITRLRDLEIRRRALHYGDLGSGALDYAGLVEIGRAHV